MPKNITDINIGLHTEENFCFTLHSYNPGLAFDLGRDVIAASIFNHLLLHIRSKIAQAKNLDSNGDTWATLSKTGIANFMPEFTENQVRTAIDKLIENGILKKKLSNWKNSYAITESGWKYAPLSKEEQGLAIVPNAPEIRETKKEKERKETKNEEYNAEIKEIVAYLNEKTGSSFRDSTTATRKHITARLKDGFSKQDCFDVIDVMSDKWLNNDKMKEYLRPITLFNSEKFEGYLGNAKSFKKENKPVAPVFINRQVSKQDTYLKLVKFGCITATEEVDKTKYLQIRHLLTEEERLIADAW